MARQRMLKGAMVAISIALLLAPNPALLAPTLEPNQHLEKIERRQTANMLNIPTLAVDAYNGLAVTFVYVSYTTFCVTYVLNDLCMSCRVR